MFFVFEKIVLGMAALRFISSFLEFTGAFLMLRFNSVETAFKINALLAVTGPTVMITVTSLGLLGLAGKASLQGLVPILTGIALILYGVHKL
ncbi:MAG: YqhV family protein [Peptococcaceae bacterium]|nr:YqhV family protein [Peptococcaceae bacterium]